MYNVTLHYDNEQIGEASHEMYSEAAQMAIDEMPAMFLAIPRDVELRCTKAGEHQFAVPLQAHLEAFRAPL